MQLQILKILYNKGDTYYDMNSMYITPVISCRITKNMISYLSHTHVCIGLPIFDFDGSTEAISDSSH